MKILLLSNPNSIHTIKWAKSLAEKNMELYIFGLGTLSVDDYEIYKNITVITLNQSINRNEGSFSKLKYLHALPIVKKIIKEFQPDIVHSHYASSYGFLGALSGFHPFILSVWGSDVFSFPNKSFMHKALLKFNLKKANQILSTSNVMAFETKKYTDKEIIVTPFGIDIEHFKPTKVESLFHKDTIVVGTVKTLEEKCGIEYLIRAFKIVYDRHKELPLRLLIVGGGSLQIKLEQLTKELNIENQTIFTGTVPHADVSIYHNMLTVFATLSIVDSESFGVAVIEASSCAKPVVVSNVGGLPEVVENGVTGLIVPVKNIPLTADAIERLIIDQNLRDKIGDAGRKRVKNLYNWKNNVAQMINIYKAILK